MTDAEYATMIKDWLTSAAIVLGGLWAIWRFYHSEWLRSRREVPSLEGNSIGPEILAIGNDRAVVSLRWSWRITGTIPVYIDSELSFVVIHRLPEEVGAFLDPRQDDGELEVDGLHYPLRGYKPYFFEPGTNSSLLTLPILPAGEAYIARMVLYADSEKHPTGSYSWERWQVFRTDVPSIDLPASRDLSLAPRQKT